MNYSDFIYNEVKTKITPLDINVLEWIDNKTDLAQKIPTCIINNISTFEVGDISNIDQNFFYELTDQIDIIFGYNIQGSKESENKARIKYNELKAELIKALTPLKTITNIDNDNNQKCFIANAKFKSSEARNEINHKQVYYIFTFYINYNLTQL